MWTPPPPLRPPDVIHVISVPRPSLFFTTLLLPCIILILNANQRKTTTTTTTTKQGRPGNTYHYAAQEEEFTVTHRGSVTPGKCNTKPFFILAKFNRYQPVSDESVASYLLLLLESWITMTNYHGSLVNITA